MNNLLQDYVGYENSYCHKLEPMQSKLKAIAFGNNNIRLSQMRKIVGGIIKDAAWTKKKAEFIKKMNTEIHSKRKLYIYIKNSINKALQTLVPVQQ